jgi:hypothetical protein
VVFVPSVFVVVQRFEEWRASRRKPRAAEPAPAAAIATTPPSS